MIFDRLRAKTQARRAQVKTTEYAAAALDDFVTSRPGVQAWAEAATGFNKTSLLLVAASGEWLRYPVPDIDWAHDFTRRAGLVCFTAGIDPYPQRMRDWDTAHRKPSPSQEA